MPTSPGADPSVALARLATAAIDAATDVWTRGLAIGARCVTALIAAPPPDAPLPAPAGARQLAAELAALPGLALERFGAALDPHAADAAAPGESAPVDGRRVVFPLRVQDASQGLAVYAVPAPAAQALLDARHHGDLVAADIGRGCAALQIYVVDYRVADLGAYRELGVAVLAAPRRRPLQAGLAVLAEPVTGRFACRAGVEIWGDPKTEERLDLDAGADALACTLVRASSGAPVLTVTLPRGGAGVSTGVPLTLYTRLHGRLHASRLTRSGRGERARAGGRGVGLALHDDADPLGRALRSLGLPEAPAIFHMWTEQMTVRVSRPVPVAEAPARTAPVEAISRPPGRRPSRRS
jgi:hypothetical protein